MRLFKNKKAMDYSAFLVIIVAIVVVFLVIQLYAKLDVFKMRIGEQEVVLMNAYQEGDKLMLFVDQSAKYSVYKALGDIAFNAGFIFQNEPCGVIGPLPLKDITGRYPFWFKDNKKCYQDIDFYQIFEHYLNFNLDFYFSKYPSYIPRDNYEFVVSKNEILGIPVKPISLPLIAPADKKEHYGEVMSVVLKEFDAIGIGIYVVRPSFRVDADALLDDFSSLPSKVDALLECVHSSGIDECVKEISTQEVEWLFEKIPDTETYVFDVKMNNLDNPFDSDPVVIRFALENPLNFYFVPNF
ncbi:hypothetical protein JW851_01695 [Candidatus Woesearchaeota archaeon]|nr:hypothetical protein [Candidatus Woesearchaeota archaeon]